MKSFFTLVRNVTVYEAGFGMLGALAKAPNGSTRVEAEY
jgi:hypothetical protein